MRTIQARRSPGPIAGLALPEGWSAIRRNPAAQVARIPGIRSEGLPATETRQAWLVVSWDDANRGGQKPCWVYRQVLQQGGSAEFVPERVENSRLWWFECYRKNRASVVVCPQVGSSVVFKHHGCAAGARRWFRLRRYRGVAAYPVASHISVWENPPQRHDR